MAEKRILIDGPTLAQKMREAQTAHHEYEKTLGHADENWPDWYAKFIVDQTPLISSLQLSR